jgi:membrane protein
LFGATGVLVQLQKSLNNIWEVKVDPKKEKWWFTLKSRLFSLGIIVTLGFLMLISMAVTIALVALSDWLEARFPDAIAYLVEAVNFIISLAVIAVLFALVFKVLPDAKIKWRHVIIGGFHYFVTFLSWENLPWDFTSAKANLLLPMELRVPSCSFCCGFLTHP